MHRRDFLHQGLAVAGAAALPTLATPLATPAQAAVPQFVHPGIRGRDEIIAEAKANIDRYRKSEVTIQVLRGDGKPLANTRVDLIQTKQDYLFGDCNWGMEVLFQAGKAQTPHMQFWQELFAAVFNAMNITCYWTERTRYSVMRMEEQQGNIQLQGFDFAANWALAQGLTCKGHPLFWPVDKAVPQWLTRYDYATQLRFLEVHVRDLVSRYRGKVQLWDAVNEMLWEPALKNLPQRRWPHIESTTDMVEYIAPIIRWARSEDPAASFVLNDYGIEADEKPNLVAADGSAVTFQRQRQRYLDLIKALREAGASPNALGMQCHSGGWQEPNAQWQFYDQMATAGLPLHVTEFWAHTNHLQTSGTEVVADNGEFFQRKIKAKPGQKTLSPQEIDARQAEFAAQYLTCAYGHPAVQAFFFWGFMANAVTFKDNAYEVKPYYTAIQKLIREEWMTRTRATTNSEGRLTFRGFTGQYQLQYPVAGGPSAAAAFMHSRGVGQQTVVAVLG